MIKYAENREHIISLWAEAFGDSREDILFFIDNVKDAKCLMYYFGDRPASMMYLVPCMIDGCEFRYIYAACTAKAYEGRGFMTDLIHCCLDSGIRVCLIPASDSLIDCYSKREINLQVPIESLTFHQIPAIEEYLFEGYDLTIPTALRSK